MKTPILILLLLLLAVPSTYYAHSADPFIDKMMSDAIVKNDALATQGFLSNVIREIVPEAKTDGLQTPSRRPARAVHVAHFSSPSWGEDTPLADTGWFLSKGLLVLLFLFQMLLMYKSFAGS